MEMATTIPIDRYVLDTLMRDLIGHDRTPAAFATYLAVVSAGADGRIALSHQELAWRTGLSKRSVQGAVEHLVGRGLLRRERGAGNEPATLVPLTPWRRGPAERA